MKDLEQLTRHKFKNILDKTKYESFIRIAKFCDEHEEEAPLWTPTEAYEAFKIEVVSSNDLVLDMALPNLDDFKQFFKDKTVNQLLLDMVIQRQALALRQIITNIKDNKNISQGDMKALNLLMDMINNSIENDNGITYIQLMTPTRFSGHDREAIIKSIGEIDED